MCVYIHTYISVYEYVHMHVLYTGFSGGSVVKNLPANAGDTGSIPGLERSPEDKIATHFSILAWKIPRTEAPGRLQSMGFQRDRRDWATDIFQIPWSKALPFVLLNLISTPFETLTTWDSHRMPIALGSYFWPSADKRRETPVFEGPNCFY